MALMYPSSPDFSNSSEEIVYEVIKAKLPQSYVCYFNYVIEKKEFDIAILAPDRGIIVLEIKGWSANQVLKVPDNSNIIYRTKSGIEMSYPSPYKQANGYRFAFRNRIEMELQKNVLVIPVVCFPLITRQQYLDTRLDIISPQELTLLKEDLEGNLVEVIDGIFNSFSNIDVDSFNKDIMRSVRLFFETEEQVNETMPQGKENMTFKKREYYSRLEYVPSELDTASFINLCDELLILWCEGTKIIFISEDANKIQLLKERLHLTLVDRRLDQYFKFLDPNGELSDSIFNFVFYKVNESLGVPFSILNGSGYQSYESLLEMVDKETLFNLNQYKIEHAQIDENICIRAGAGSGKTYSMISRISYLIYAHSLTHESLKDAIYLITFTNEAAENMKIRLQEYFLNYFLVTKDFGVYKMIESIEDMKISTIHSLVKRILTKFSVVLGLGKELSIATGKYERDQELAKVLDSYINENELDPSSFNLTMYHLQRRIRDLIEKIVSKNIDVVSDKIDYGESFIPIFDQLLKKLPKATESQVRAQFDEINKMRLSDLMMRLKQVILREKETFMNYRNKIKYVFVDEFQDTDDVQISLMNEIQKMIGYHYFVVGDIKQCIYRFRGAEIKAFDQLTNNNDTWGKEFNLVKNYRSDRLLLERFEQSFTSWGSGDSPRLVYNPVKDRLVSKLSLNSKEDPFFEEIQTDQSQFENHFIGKLKELYEQLPDDETLAILVRENKEVEKIRKLGLKHGLFIETDVGGNLYRLEPTIDLYKLVLALQHSKSPRHLLNLYTTSYVDQAIPKSELYATRKDRENMLQLFKNKSIILNWDKYLHDLKREPIMFVLREIMLDTKPWEKFAQKQNFPPDQQLKLQKYYKRNLDQLFEQLTKIGDGDYLTINRIERFLHIMIVTKQSEESREQVQTLEENAKRIVCMTVHKSKGLEFHTVILPFTNKDIIGNKKSGPVEVIVLGNENAGYRVGYKIRLDEPINGYKALTNNIYRAERDNEKNERIHEETRILYVALTRTAQRFIYFYHTDCQEQMTWQNMIREVTS